MKDLFPPLEPKDIRIEDIVKELRRELAVRRDVYPYWISKRTIDVETATYRIAVLEAAITYFTDRGD